MDIVGGMTLVVMAAGRGSRFGGLKQVTPVGPSGEVLFDYAVYDAVRSGIDDVVFVVSEASRDAVKTHVDGGCGRHVEVRYVEQRAGNRPKPLGTGHALLRACSEVDGSFGVVNADDFYGRRSFELLATELAAEDRTTSWWPSASRTRCPPTAVSPGGCARWTKGSLSPSASSTTWLRWTECCAAVRACP